MKMNDYENKSFRDVDDEVTVKYFQNDAEKIDRDALVEGIRDLQRIASRYAMLEDMRYDDERLI